MSHPISFLSFGLEPCMVHIEAYSSLQGSVWGNTIGKIRGLLSNYLRITAFHGITPVRTQHRAALKKKE